MHAATMGNSSRPAIVDSPSVVELIVVEPWLHQPPAGQAAEHRAHRQVKPVGVDDANQPGLVADRADVAAQIVLRLDV